MRPARGSTASILVACGPDGFARETKARGGGILTSLIIDGLRTRRQEAADPTTGHVSLESLRDWMWKEIDASDDLACLHNDKPRLHTSGGPTFYLTLEHRGSGARVATPGRSETRGRPTAPDILPENRSPLQQTSTEIISHQPVATETADPEPPASNPASSALPDRTWSPQAEPEASQTAEIGHPALKIASQVETTSQAAEAGLQNPEEEELSDTEAERVRRLEDKAALRRETLRRREEALNVARQEVERAKRIKETDYEAEQERPSEAAPRKTEEERTAISRSTKGPSGTGGRSRSTKGRRGAGGRRSSSRKGRSTATAS